MVVKPVREGFHTVTPYLMVRGVDRLVNFIQQAFGGIETYRTTGSAGGTHVEMQIGDSMIMMGGATTTEPMPVAIYLYMNNVDEVYQKALQAGATSIMEPADSSDGERRAGVADPFGNSWYIGAPL
jgi:uncharacterized glyoxalase superfamily protein PhnB